MDTASEELHDGTASFGFAEIVMLCALLQDFEYPEHELSIRVPIHTGQVEAMSELNGQGSGTHVFSRPFTSQV